jgi:hypothetical protein
LRARNVFADEFYGLIKLVLAASCDENVRSLFDEQFGCRERHAGGSGGDDCYFAVELAHIFTPFLCSTLDGIFGAVARAAPRIDLMNRWAGHEGRYNSSELMNY